MLREWLDRITVFHVDTGDMLPEMREIVAHVRTMAPNFVHVQRDVPTWIVEHGLPSDLLPFQSHHVGRLVGQEKVRLVPRYDCCAANIMLPVWEAMQEAGVTLVIRGTRLEDMPTLPVASGDILDGVEFLYPVQGLSAAQVFDYLRSVGAPVARIYEYGASGPDCGACPAWLGERRAAYLRQFYPDQFTVYRERVAAVVSEVAPAVAAMVEEMKELSK